MLTNCSIFKDPEESGSSSHQAAGRKRRAAPGGGDGGSAASAAWRRKTDLASFQRAPTKEDDADAAKKRRAPVSCIQRSLCSFSISQYNRQTLAASVCYSEFSALNACMFSEWKELRLFPEAGLSTCAGCPREVWGCDPEEVLTDELVGCPAASADD
jgi:hypothetical protein